MAVEPNYDELLAKVENVSSVEELDKLMEDSGYAVVDGAAVEETDELNEDALEDVSGGALVPVVAWTIARKFGKSIAWAIKYLRQRGII